MSELASFACPRCLSALAPARAGELRCDCGHVTPVLGGVPILVPDPAVWCARYREAALATLAETGRLTPPDLDRLNSWAERTRGVAADRFSDDWVGAEVGAANVGMQVGSAAATELAQWVQARRAQPFEDRLAAHVEGAGLEVGCGAATATTALLRRGSVVSGDMSLRAALHAADKGASPAVFDAHALPFAGGTFDWIVAANVVDLLDDPAAFLAGALACLRPGGRLVVSTPDPALGGDHDVLVPLLDEVGFGIVRVEDGLPWMRAHHARHLEVYINQLVVGQAP
ncbi:MAG: class I SAM-dependent methyltransferase [Sandaracinaceae bacterium]